MKKLQKNLSPASVLGVLATLAAPAVVSAQTTINTILADIESILDTAIPILVTAGVAYFIFGVIQYVTAKDEEKKKEARSVMVSGIIGLFIILALWGIINVLSNTFGIGLGGTIGTSTIPGVQ